MHPNDKGPAALPTPDRLASAADDETSVAETAEGVDVHMMEALEQSRARWGSAAVVAEERVIAADGTAATMRFVGRVAGDHYAWAVLGRGLTWRAAFAAADRRGGLSR